MTLLDLVRNGTMDHRVAATLWSIADEKRSFLVVAIPRFAGKTTLSSAMLQLVPRGTPLHHLSGDVAEMERLRASPDRGYLVVGEFAKGSVSNYIWGEPVRKAFETARAGFSLTAALHASGVKEAFRAICAGNEVRDDAASLIDYLVYIERMGTDRQDFWRRVAAVYEIERVADGIPRTRLLHRWRESDDVFEPVETPRLLSIGAEGLAARAALIRAMVARGQTSDEHVEALRREPPRR